MRKSQELIEGKLTQNGVHAEVKYVVAKETRKITVNGKAAFEQGRGDCGQFKGDFADLSLP